jgi:hypothetical protein
MKQIVTSVCMLAIALALVIGVVVPIFLHGADSGSKAVERGRNALPLIEQVLDNR